VGAVFDDVDVHAQKRDSKHASCRKWGGHPGSGRLFTNHNLIFILIFYWIFILLCIHWNPIELMVEKEMMEEERAEINFHVCKLRIAQSLPLDVNLGFNKK